MKRQKNSIEMSEKLKSDINDKSVEGIVKEIEHFEQAMKEM